MGMLGWWIANEPQHQHQTPHTKQNHLNSSNQKLQSQYQDRLSEHKTIPTLRTNYQTARAIAFLEWKHARNNSSSPLNPRDQNTGRKEKQSSLTQTRRIKSQQTPIQNFKNHPCLFSLHLPTSPPDIGIEC
jgi:hypothetical protein